MTVILVNNMGTHQWNVLHRSGQDRYICAYKIIKMNNARQMLVVDELGSCANTRHAHRTHMKTLECPPANTLLLVMFCSRFVCVFTILLLVALFVTMEQDLECQGRRAQQRRVDA